jgi:type I restriction enzyme M protein
MVMHMAAPSVAIVVEIEAEQALVDGNRQLIDLFERKTQARLAEIWGEAEVSL